MLNKITDKEMEMITYWRRKYGPKTDDETLALSREEFASNEYWLRYWQKAKANIYKAFGEKLIITKEISYEAPENEIAILIRQYKSKAKEGDPFCEFISRFNNKLTQAGAEWDAFNLTNDYHLAEKDVQTLYLRNNTINLGKFGKIKVAPQEKIVRVIRKISEIIGMDMDLFEKFRIQHSIFFNQKRFKGTLCLSIHPLDFITMSDNDHNWSSCMSWRHIGEYRMGTIDMMNSNCAVVAYFKSDDTNMSEIEWNSKRWRELFICSKKVIAGIKGYPYHSENLENTVLSWLIELMGGTNNYTERLNLYDNDHFVDSDISFKYHFETDYMYNDFGCTKDSINPVYFSKDYTDSLASSDYGVFSYSGAGICAWCGNCECFGEDGCGNVVCEYCTRNLRWCECCDKVITTDDGYYDDNGSWYCNSCVEKYFKPDPVSGALFDASNGYIAYAAYSYEGFDTAEAVGQMRTSWRFNTNNYTPEQIAKITRSNPRRCYRNPDSWAEVYVVLVEDLTEYGRQVFGITQ